MKYFLESTIFDETGNTIYQSEEPSLFTNGVFDTGRFYEGARFTYSFPLEDQERFDGDVIITKVVEKKCVGDDGFLIKIEAKTQNEH